MAVLSAKVFAIEIERTNQSSFIIFQGQKEHNDEAIKKAKKENPDFKFKVKSIQLVTLNKDSSIKKIKNIKLK